MPSRYCLAIEWESSEARRTECRYMAVDADNRFIASSLRKALRKLETAKADPLAAVLRDLGVRALTDVARTAEDCSSTNPPSSHTIGCRGTRSRRCSLAYCSPR
jgi:hypothetical protein